jgi:hypothetical protein
MSLRLIVVDDESLERSKSGAIWGRVYFENGDQFFPEEGWTDMALPLLNAWLEALVRIASHSTREETVWFMDGPFKVALFAKGDGGVEVRLIHDEIVGQSAKVAIEDLLQNAIELGERLLSVCELRGWRDRETRTLADGTKRGKDFLSQLEG